MVPLVKTKQKQKETNKVTDKLDSITIIFNTITSTFIHKDFRDK